MEKVRIILKGGIAIIKDITFVGIKVEVFDYDTDSKPVIRSYTKNLEGDIKESKRPLI